MTNSATQQNKTEFTALRRIMTDYSIMLSAPILVGIFNYGIKVVFSVFLGVFTCAVCGKIAEKILKVKFPLRDFSPFFLGACTALMMPATAPWWLIVCASAFAMVVCVVPFGSANDAPFVPPAAAFCFAAICWSDIVFDYSETGNSVTLLLSQGNSIGQNVAAVLEVLVGNVPSAIGTGSALALFGALIFLIIRRPKDSISSLTFILAVAVMALLFPRVGTGRFISLIMELCGGMMLFSAVFFMSFPSILPKRLLPRAVWGFVSGIICMLIRYVGAFEETAVFGILIACAIADFFDKLPLTKKEKLLLVKEEEIVEVPAPTFVPDEVLSEIPDISEEEIIEQTEEVAEEVEVPIIQESESLEDVISEENDVTVEDSPFITGGDDNE